MEIALNLLRESSGKNDDGTMPDSISQKQKDCRELFWAP